MRTLSRNVQAGKSSFRRQWSRFVRAASGGADDARFPVASWPGTTDLDQFAKDLRSRGIEQTRPGHLPSVNRKLLLDEVRALHNRAGTLTPSVAANISQYLRGCPSVRLAHQPNFLPSTNIIGQAAMLSRLAELLATDTAQLCFVIDYDVNTDRRYRTSMLPSMSARKGYNSLSLPGMHKRDECFIYAEKKPPEDFAANISGFLRECTAQDLALVRKLCGGTMLDRGELKRRTSLIEGHLTAAFRTARTVAEANTIFLSRLVNLVLGLPTLFVPGSAALGLLPEHMAYLWDRSWHLNRICRQVATDLENHGLIVGRGLILNEAIAPFWTPCPRDSKRVTMLWSDRGHKKASGICSQCHTKVVIRARSVGQLSKSSQQPSLVPRIIWDDLLDGFAWGHLAGCSYPGGLEHYIFTACVAARLGLKSLPEFFSQCSRSLGPESDFEYAARRAEVMGSYIPGAVGIQNALRLEAKGRGSFVHTMLWRGEPDPKALVAAFSEEIS